MYTYNLKSSMSDRVNLDQKAQNDGYIDGYVDASEHCPAVTDRALEQHASNLVDLALDGNKGLTDDIEAYRARYVYAYCKAYKEQVAEE